MITIFIFCLIAYTIGFLAGHENGKQRDVIQSVNNAAHMLIDKVITANHVKPGVIRRPSAKDLQDRKAPQSVRDGRNEMLKTLDQIPELQEHKRLLKEMEKIQP